MATYENPKHVPYVPKRAMGAPDALSIDPKDVAKIAKSKPSQEQLTKLHPALKEAVLKHLESQKPSKKKTPVPEIKLPEKSEPTGESTPSIRPPKNSELRRGITAVPVNKPKRKKSPRTRTKTGKKLDPTTGKIATPKVGQIGKIGGEVVRVTPENVQQVHEERVRTTLPEAGPEVMRPQSPGPRVPLEAPEGGLREKVWIDSKTGKPSRKLRGFGVPAEQVHAKAWEAMGHLDSMMNHQPGSPEHTKHREAFVKAHGDLHPMSSDAHQILSMAAIVASRPKYPQQTSHLNKIKDALSERISIGRAMEKRRAAAQRGNRGQKMAVNSSRSMNASLNEGATDGKYRKARPDTEVMYGSGDEATIDNRQSLHPFYGYGFLTSEYPNKVNPGK